MTLLVNFKANTSLYTGEEEVGNSSDYVQTSYHPNRVLHVEFNSGSITIGP